VSRLTSLMLLAFMLCGTEAFAQGTLPGDPAVVPVRVNTEFRGDLTVRVMEKDVLISNGDLLQLGIHLSEEQMLEAEMAAGWISLAALAPAVLFTFDEETFRLGIEADPALLGELRMSPRERNRPAGLVYASSPSLFVNYAASGSSFDNLGLFTEIGWGSRTGLFQTTLGRTGTGDLQRGLTQYVRDDRRRLVRWVAGDAALGT
jgi:outer membrane usher protein FimD/PapC